MLKHNLQAALAVWAVLAPLSATAARVTVELAGAEGVKSVGAIARWDKDGNARRVPDPKAKIDAPTVDAEAADTGHRPGTGAASVGGGRRPLGVQGPAAGQVRSGDPGPRPVACGGVSVRSGPRVRPLLSARRDNRRRHPRVNRRRHPPVAALREQGRAAVPRRRQEGGPRAGDADPRQAYQLRTGIAGRGHDPPRDLAGTRGTTAAGKRRNGPRCSTA